MTTIINGSSPSITFSDGSAQTSATRPFLNRIINGAMVIDQRNAGASVTIAGGYTYTIDRWQAGASASSKYSVQQNAGSVTPPTGFINYLGVTSLSAYSVPSGEIFVIRQLIEGLNVSDLGWGTADAKTVTLSFQVRSSLTGTFGGSLQNSAGDRSYPFSYTISSANTWTTVSITVAGDTSGTWLRTNGVGLICIFSLGSGSTYSGTAGSWSANNYVSATGATSVVGTNGATFYITGVQLEVGSTATSFDYRPYQQELALCQRYYAKTFLQETAPAQNAGQTNSIVTRATVTGQPISAQWKLPVSMRATPTVTTFNPLAADANWTANPSSPVVAVDVGAEVVSVHGTTNTTFGNAYKIHLVAAIEL